MKYTYIPKGMKRELCELRLDGASGMGVDKIGEDGDKASVGCWGV